MGLMLLDFNMIFYFNILFNLIKCLLNYITMNESAKTTK